MLWGFGFIATRWAMLGFNSTLLTGARFFLASVCILPVVLLSRKMRKKLSRKEFYLSFVPGFFLSLALVLQTIGLEYTTVTNSGFITVMYVVLVPALEVMMFGRRIQPFHILGIAVALFGAALMCNLRDISSVNLGDGLTFLCALASAMQIAVMEKVSARISSPFLFNLYQAFWAGVGPLIAAFALAFTGSVQQIAHAPGLAWAGILFLIFGSTMIGFLVQVRAQRVLPGSTASMFFLLESPFAAIFGYLLLGEKLSPLQWCGALLILSAAAITIRTAAPVKR